MSDFDMLCVYSLSCADFATLINMDHMLVGLWLRIVVSQHTGKAPNASCVSALNLDQHHPKILYGTLVLTSYIHQCLVGCY